VLLFAAYEVYGKAYQVNSDQHRLDAALNKQWATAAARTPKAAATTKAAVVSDPLPGEAIARLYIPRLDKKWVVVQGVTPKDIKLAPGHYENSQLPGQIGNFAVAGHRMPSIFWNLDRVQPGDTIVVETRTDWFVYTVTSNFITKPTNVSVVGPNPEHPGRSATDRMLTLTTCNPKWDNYQRMIVWAKQVRTQPQSAGKPAEVS
jgi:sortase A